MPSILIYLLAYISCIKGGHLGHAPITNYLNEKKAKWKSFVFETAQIWEEMNLDWFYGFAPTNRHVVFYDHLKVSPEDELRSLLDFLGISVSNKTMKCVIERKEGLFKRKKRWPKLNPFDESMKKLISLKMRKVYKILLSK